MRTLPVLFRSKSARKREHLDRLALPGPQPLLTETSRRAHVESLLKQRDPERLAADVITLQRQFSSLQEEHVRHSMCSVESIPCLSKFSIMQDEIVRQCVFCWLCASPWHGFAAQQPAALACQAATVTAFGVSKITQQGIQAQLPAWLAMSHLTACRAVLQIEHARLQMVCWPCWCQKCRGSSCRQEESMMHSMQSVVHASLSHVRQQYCCLQEEHLSFMFAPAWSHPGRAAVGWGEACVLIT